jgi:hypothetical protein
MRLLRALFLLLTAVRLGAADLQFVGIMAVAPRTLFAVRSDAAAPVRWVAVGDTVGAYRIIGYDPKTDALTLARGDTRITLRLPDARVGLARDEVLAGLQQTLNLRDAGSYRDLLHPALRARFKAEDLDRRVFAEVATPGTKMEIREIPPEFAAALAAGLTEVARAVGSRPTHGIWITTTKGFSMSFVVKSGDAWYLAPSVPPME